MLRADEFSSGPVRVAPELRAEFFAKARPAISNLLVETEQDIGMKVVFIALPTNDAVIARFIYDTTRNEPQVQLRAGWEDVDVAHELIHTRMDLVDRFAMLAWRRGVKRTPEGEAAFARVQTYVKDELVHARLVKIGLRLDGEVIRASLFDSLYTEAAQRLERGAKRADDGLAHLDKLGRGTLCRASFLIQAELLLKRYRDQLPPLRVRQTERFIRAFREHRAVESEYADKILNLFALHDATTTDGHRALLDAWTKLEQLDDIVGTSTYQRTSDGIFRLPFPE